MKIRGFYIVACILTVISTSCRKDYNEEVQAVSGYDREASMEAMEEMIVDFSCVQLQKTPASVLNSIEKVEMVDSTLLVSDGTRLLAFARNGKYLHGFGNPGKDYQTLTTFFIDTEGNVVLIDAPAGRFVKYTPSGKFIAERSVNETLLTNIQDAYMPEKGKLFASRYISTGSNTLYEMIDLERECLEDLEHTSIKTANTLERIGIHPFTHYENSIRWVRPFSKKVSGYNIEYPLLINSSKREPQKGELQRIDDLSVAIYHPFMQDKLFVGFTDIYETKDHILLFCLDVECVAINKRNWKCSRYEYPRGDVYQSLPILAPKAVYKDNIIGLLFPQELMKFHIGDNATDALRQLLDLQQRMDKNGNPLLLIYEI